MDRRELVAVTRAGLPSELRDIDAAAVGLAYSAVCLRREANLEALLAIQM